MMSSFRSAVELSGWMQHTYNLFRIILAEYGSIIVDLAGFVDQQGTGGWDIAMS